MIDAVISSFFAQSSSFRCVESFRRVAPCEGHKCYQW
jgi:hypothetical protein